VRFLSADFIFPVSSPALSNGIVAVKDDGVIDGVYRSHDLPDHTYIEKFHGIICPGFVNAHCHLELSYLKGKIKPHTGLKGFIEQLLKSRNQYQDAEAIKSAVAEADKMMFENGISAVGDISNESISFSVKSQSRISYHTFIELYDFEKEKTEAAVEKGKQLLRQGSGLRISLAPHATYSVTHQLLSEIFALNSSQPVSIHHDETESEEKLLKDKTGLLFDFFKQHFKKDYARHEQFASLKTILESVNHNQNLLLVHNTYSTEEDIEKVKQSEKNVYWCFCPKANLFIENRLPDFNLFSSVPDCCLGTDSLASNDTLCILEEIKSVLQHYPKFSTETMIRWATLNGAKALMMEAQFGSLEKNKKPGIILIENTDGDRITFESKVKRLV
jgi:cytosine/adenosine deaminase-related metal-dependent hydrolase